MKFTTLCFAILAFTVVKTNAVQAQDKPAVDHSYKPLTLKLNDDGSKYVRFIMWHQFWATATQNNPGTRDNSGALIDGSTGADKAWTTDFGLRRSRFLAYAQVSPRFLILTHWGINNQSFTNGGVTAGASNGGKKPQLYVHDAWTEYQVLKDKLYIGGGLHYWNGISRLTSQSTLNFMTMDAPIFNWATIEAGDQFARQLGLYAKGQLGRLDYRLALNKPYANGTAAAAVGRTGQATNVLTETWAQAGYVNWMFADKESNKLPYFVGSYLGTKKVINVGAGFYRQAGASLAKTASDSTYYDHLLLGADVFVDLPLNKTKGTALNFLAAYYNFNFGPDYIRNIGILNLHTNTVGTDVSYAGAGNAQPTIGTGSIVYVQAGYLLPKFKNGTAFMPYATVTMKSFERLADPSTQFSLGLNYLVSGHNAKITLEYATRPVYAVDAASGDIKLDKSRGQLTLQTHIFL